MDMMAWNDLDIDIENETMSLDKMYKLTSFIMDTFHPVWYEAKEEINAEGKKVWFHGFETMITGELWNVDLWFFDRETIEEAERYLLGEEKMIQIRYVQAEDKEFWYSLDRHLPETEFEDKVRNKRGYVLLEENKPIGLLRYNLFWDNTPFCTLLFIEWNYH